LYVAKKRGKNLTLKAFANSSPGLRFGNRGKAPLILEEATLKELRRSLNARSATPSELRGIFGKLFLKPGFQSKPWSGIGERFSA
jgi:hypothetical protein